MDQGAATAMTPQGGRTPTGLPTSNPAMCPQGDYVLKFTTFSRLYEPWRINKSITKGKML